MSGNESRDHGSPPDVLLGGQPGLRQALFLWKVDSERLKDVNRATGMDSTVSHLRGFAARLITVWMDTRPELRPAVEFSTMWSEDLVYIPSPCYVFALSAERDRLRCWYSQFADTAASEFLNAKAGIELFELSGDPGLISDYTDGIVRLFRFRSKTRAEGYTFFRRF